MGHIGHMFLTHLTYLTLMTPCVSKKVLTRISSQFDRAAKDNLFALFEAGRYDWACSLIMFYKLFNPLLPEAKLMNDVWYVPE